MVGHPLTQLKKNTLEALKESVSNSSKIKKVILENMVYEVKKTLTLNLVQITYQFSTRNVFIDYFVEDSSYPGVQMSSDELADFIELP